MNGYALLVIPDTARNQKIITVHKRVSDPRVIIWMKQNLPDLWHIAQEIFQVLGIQMSAAMINAGRAIYDHGQLVRILNVVLRYKLVQERIEIAPALFDCAMEGPWNFIHDLPSPRSPLSVLTLE